MIIAITGSHGFIGSRFADYALADGHQVRFLERPIYSIETACDREWLADVDLLIHCAWDKDHQRNVLGTGKLLDLATQCRIKRIVVLSSLSFDAPSAYGRAKKQIETMIVDHPNFAIVRPGLVYDAAPEGLLGRIIGLAKYSPVLPTISGSTQYTCHIQDLWRCVMSVESGVHSAASSSPVPMEAIVRHFAGKRLFIPIAPSFMAFCIRCINAIGIQAITQDNLTGFLNPPQPFSSEGFRDFPQ